MKKFNYLVLPLLAAPLIASCGGAKCAKVTEEEFNNAIVNKDVSYLQVNATLGFINEETDKIEDMSINAKLSPTTFYMKMVDTDMNIQTYSKISSDKKTVNVAYKMEEETKWTEETLSYEEAIEDFYWVEPNMIGAKYFIAMVGSYNYSYKDFEYKTSGYYAELKVDDENETGADLNKTSIFFTGKKVTKVNLTSYYIDPETKKEEKISTEKVSYTYKEETPKDPRK